MSFFPGGFGSQGGGADGVDPRQAAVQRLAAQAFQQSCAFKVVMAGCGGFVIGGAMGTFLSGMRYDAPGAFAMPGGGGTAAFNNLKWHRQLYEGIKDMGTQGYKTGKSFGRIGAMFSGTECVLESYRAKSDMTNPILAGALVGAWLAKAQGPLAVAGGAAGFAAFSWAIELYMHRETADDD